MVQRKVPNKFGIKPHHLKSDTHLLVNLRPSSPQTHEKLTKIMKKSRQIKRSDESRSLPPFKKKKTQVSHNDEPRSTPNYMKSTSCFDARRERSPTKTPTSTKSSKTNGGGLDSGHKGSRTTSSLKMRALTKTPSFKPIRPSKKVILCEDLDAQRATCSSTLKESKFPDYLQLNPGGTQLEGSSAMKICPYTYCSLNGHHAAPVPPLKCFLSAKRQAIKTQKSFKLGCLSPRQTKPVVKTNDIKEMAQEVDVERTRVTKEEEEEEEEEGGCGDLFIEINGSRDFECSDIEWEEGYCSEKSKDDVCDEQIQKTGDKKLHSEFEELYDEKLQGELEELTDEKLHGELEELYVEKLCRKLDELYDEESVSSGAWTEEEEGDSESDSSYQRTKINRKIKDQDLMNYDEFEVSSTDANANANEKMDELQSMDFSTGDENITCSVDYWREETSQESKGIPEKSEDGNEKNRTTIIYNFIQFNISIFVNGEKTENFETYKGFVDDTTMKIKDVSEFMEEQGMSNVDDAAQNLDAFESQEIVPSEQLNANYFVVFKDDNLKELDEEPAISSDKEQTNLTDEVRFETDLKAGSLCQKSDFVDEQPDLATNIRGPTRGGTKRQQEMDDSREFNPRGPNFLPEVEDPDAESVDLKHQDMDERKNAEEWMVDYALQQAVTTLAPVRKKKVALLVEAFEKVGKLQRYDDDGNVIEYGI
ncbi:uncharacterized protein [Rutidosis leptorrhynchoides]|uniref:uncharacterized protein isoform X2 n=1 Tax=Rutidosis leptorrhynchoides TaxID=125765 RepID=UPI003A9A342B